MTEKELEERLPDSFKKLFLQSGKVRHINRASTHQDRREALAYGFGYGLIVMLLDLKHKKVIYALTPLAMKIKESYNEKKS